MQEKWKGGVLIFFGKPRHALITAEYAISQQLAAFLAASIARRRVDRISRLRMRD